LENLLLISKTIFKTNRVLKMANLINNFFNWFYMTIAVSYYFYYIYKLCRLMNTNVKAAFTLLKRFNP